MQAAGALLACSERFLLYPLLPSRVRLLDEARRLQSLCADTLPLNFAGIRKVTPVASPRVQAEMQIGLHWCQLRRRASRQCASKSIQP